MDGVILDPRERCEKEEEFNSWEVLGLTAAIIGMVQWIPEMITVFTSTSLEAASIIFPIFVQLIHSDPWLFLLGGVSNVMWTVYGFAVNSISVIAYYEKL